MGTVPERLASAINRAFGEMVAGSGSTSLPVSVGSESDLAGLGRFDLAVVADADGLIHAQHFRAGEEALRILGRLGNAVATGSGKRLMIQTSMPESDVISTMRSGDPIPYLERLLVERARDRLPPAEAMMAVELRGVVEANEATAALHLDGVTSVLGPAEVEQGQRWLLQGDLRRAKIELRSLVQRWRDRGVTVRLDADPIDL
jgi:primosomal protein N'